MISTTVLPSTDLIWNLVLPTIDLPSKTLIKRQAAPEYTVLTCALSSLQENKCINACVGVHSDPVQD